MSKNNNFDSLENNLKAHLNVTLDITEQEFWLQTQSLSKLKEEYIAALLKAYNYHFNLSGNFWSRLLTEGISRFTYNYLGPLPDEAGCIIVSDFLIKPAITKLYKIKPVAFGSKEELEM